MLNDPKSVKKQIGSDLFKLSTGKIAKQANGSVLLECGNTVLLAAVTAASEAREGVDFFPLTIEYAEKMYASGKIPGGFFKREAKPRTSATLAARLIDRPIRPSFPSDYHNEVQIIITVLSFDQSHSPEYMGIIAASAALSVSDLPFQGPVGAASVAKIDGDFIFNPSPNEIETADLHVVVAGTKDAILMIEAEAKEVPESEVVKAIEFGHGHIRSIIGLQEELVAIAGKEKNGYNAPEKLTDLENEIRNHLGNRIEDTLRTTKSKEEVSDFLKTVQEDVVSTFVTEELDNEKDVVKAFNVVKKEQIRKTIISHKVRPDGRRPDEVRDIETEVSLLPSSHGSALFTRGETQSLGVVTLGTSADEQIEDGLNLNAEKSKYFFHYNFPPYSVGEVGMFSRTSRRELGHGALAEKSLRSVLPAHEDFPYTIRIVSEIMESNGSSSMASVCSGTLSLMDCGVPIKAPVSGIAMGLLMDDEGNYTILSDIQGLEDHYGDMDFKVAGTDNGITSLQLDIKIAGLSEEILSNTLEQAKAGRSHILNKMMESIDKPRNDLNPNAPKIHFLSVDPEKVGLIIGPGGKMIRKIEEESGAEVVVSDNVAGQVCISAVNSASLDTACKMILGLVKEVESGEEYDGKVVRITNFGAFIELLPGKEGLLHISKVSDKRIDNVEDYLSVGDIIPVKVENIDNQNRISLIRN